MLGSKVVISVAGAPEDKGGRGGEVGHVPLSLCVIVWVPLHIRVLGPP